ncbi:MAG TPA: pyrroloquinoline quinone biosynthesis peptide chaperone PqqD [Candidatus Polarisedimenticolia bacterium]
MLDRTQVLTRNPGAAYRIYDGQATIVLPEQARVTVLNEVGSLVWDRIDGRRSLGEILDAVNEAFDVAPEQLERDVKEFLDALREQRMVS